jgi:hypothetical protein
MRLTSSSLTSSINPFNLLSAYSRPHKRYGRKIICLALALSLLILPNPELAKQITSLASSAINFVADAALNFSTNTPPPARPAAVQEKRKERLADRLNRVASIRISPSKIVVYEGETLSFNAMPVDALGQTIQGVAFSWESTDREKIAIDGAGRARFLRPGLTRIICHAGLAEESAPVLVRPGNRPFQSDEEWKRDQSGLSADGQIVGQSDGHDTDQALIASTLTDQASELPSDYNPVSTSADVPPQGFIASAKSALPKAAVPLLPQGGGGGYNGTDAVYDELWSEPRNLVGTPRNRGRGSARSCPKAATSIWECRW